MKITTRFLSVLLAALLLLAALPASAFALEEGGPGLMLEQKEALGGASLESVARAFGAKGDYDNGDLYGQLNERQRACYDALEAITIDQILKASSVQSGGKVFRRMRVNVAGITGMTLQGSFSGGTFEPSASSKNDVSDIYTDLCAAIVALRYDRPDIIWIGYLYYGYWVSQSPGSAARVTDVVFDFNLEYEGQEKTMWETMMKNANEIAGKASQQPDTYQKVLSVHDQLAEQNVYGDTEDLTAHSPYSALVSGDNHEPVCDGYSKAVKIVLDLMGIPCATPSSETHMWNNVRMDDGDWYNLDLTWDDGDEVSHEYFLIGSQTVVRGKPFSQEPEHIEENPYAAYRTESRNDLLKPLTFTFPTKNKNAYVDTQGDYAPLRFPDVKRSQWYYEHVENAVTLGLFSGDTNGRFRPADNITRAEFASVMAKSLGVDVSVYRGDASFSDVGTNKWYAPAVAWAKQSGLMSGDGGDVFRPDDPITRQEMCVVLRNATQNRASGTHAFPDDASIASWAKDAVYECYAKGYLSGDEYGNFAPRDNTQRSQAAVVCSRFAVRDGALGNGAEQQPEEGESEENA